MNELLTATSSVQEIFLKGIDSYPKEAFHKNPKNKHFLHLDRQRRDFYIALRDHLPSPPIGYYPCSGADPVPASVFGSSIIYGSLDEAKYFDFLKKNEPPRFLKYYPFIRQFGPFQQLRTIYADVLNSPFAGETFDFITVNGFSPPEGSDFLAEISRLLKSGGVFVLEDIVEVDNNGRLNNEYSNILSAILSFGFRLHKLDKYGRVIDTHYAYKEILLESDFGFDQDHNEATQFITRKNYIRRLTKGLPVNMRAHEIRVFEKS